jgi:hypothetical protein
MAMTFIISVSLSSFGPSIPETIVAMKHLLDHPLTCKHPDPDEVRRLITETGGVWSRINRLPFNLVGILQVHDQ